MLPALADLDLPELHLDLLPEVPTPTQQHLLTRLGYLSLDALTWSHPGGWRLVICIHGSGWRANQAALSTWLREEPAAAQVYRQVFQRDGRISADKTFLPAALSHYERTIGLQPLADLATTLSSLTTPWMFAAGMALDLHLGRVARPHDDLDIILDRSAQEEVIRLLKDWRLDVPTDGVYQPYRGHLYPSQHQIHARHPELQGILLVDLLLSDLSEGTWRYRRDPQITLPLSRARQWSRQGWPYLASEVVLLFKAASVGRKIRDKDQADFDRVRPSLSATSLEWLKKTLTLTQPGHVWLEEL
ncbi:hypothetical protein [Deinococcus sp. Leaf326]|uniref:nucleotidyltransferase domain-containing protein n=1 Tax=Deinococcus sp. Leaf326 TaxID=1736338 RepID=UPI000ADA5CF9|nr:hypothetical protein [Deinococcus sp. Leaf326]